MSSSRLVKAMLEYGVNEASIARVVASTRRVNAAMDDVKASAARLSSMPQPFDRLTSGAGTLGQRLRGTTSPAIERTTRELKELRDEANRVTAALDKAGNTGNTGSAGNNNRLYTFGRELKLLPAVPIPGTSQSTDAVGKVLQLLGKTGISFTQLGAAAGVAGVALGVVAIAFDAFNKQLAASKRALDGALAGEEAYSRALLASTREEATRNLEQLTREREQLQDRLAQRQQQVDSAFEQSVAARSQQLGSVLGPVATAYGDLAARVLDNQSPVAQLRESLEGMETRAADLDTQIALTTEGLEAGAFAAQHAAEAERALAAERNRLADDAINAEVRGRQQARTMSGADAQTLLSDLLFEQGQLQQFGSDTEATRIRLSQLGHELYILQALTIPAIAAREREEAATQNMTDRIDAATEAVERHADEEAKLADLKTDITEAEAASVAKLADIARDLTDKTNEAARDRDIALAEAERDAGLAREDAVRESNEALEEAEVDHRERLAKIQSDYSKDFESAVGARDALAAYEAQQTRDEQTEDEKKDYDKRRKEINKRLSDTNKDIDRKLAEQSRTVRMRYEEQLRTAQIAAQRAVELENARARAQIATMQSAFNIQQALVADWAQKIINYTYAVANAASQLGGVGKVANPNMKSASVGMNSGLGFLGGIAPSTIRAYGLGGDPPVGRRVLVGEHGPEIAEFKSPAHIYNNTETRRMTGSAGTWNLNVSGATTRTMNAVSRQQAFKAFVDLMNELGVR